MMRKIRDKDEKCLKFETFSIQRKAKILNSVSIVKLN